MKKLLRTPLLFLLLYLTIGIYTFRDFGVHIDDFTQYVIGKENYLVLIGEKKAEQIDPGLKYYGPVFETLCYAIDSSFYGEPEPIQKWGMRHIFLFSIFTLALWFIWKLALLLFKNKLVAWIILLLAAFYPRLFADAHYNSKDTLFLSLIAIGFYFLCKAITLRHTAPFVVAAVILGMASTLRLAGFFIIPAFFIAHLFALKSYNKTKLWIFQPLVFSIVFALSYYVFFPALWRNPIGEFTTLVQHITQFPWPNSTLVAGHWVNPENMPWWYFPVWFFITVPIIYHILFLVSLGIFIWKWKVYRQNTGIQFLLLFLFITAGYVVLKQPNLYDSWRQLQFLFIPFIILTGIVLTALIKQEKIWLRISVWTAVAYHSIVCFWLHPFQYVYFNEAYWAFGKSNTYDQDYWALSTGNCMRWILDNHSGAKIRVITQGSSAAWLNGFFFPKEQGREFIPVENMQEAEFEILPIRNGKPFDRGLNVVYSVCPLKDTIARVIQLKKLQ